MIRGPFPKRDLSQRRGGYIEHVVYGPVSFAIYTTLRFDDERVQAAIEAYLAKARPRPSGREVDERLVDAVRRARQAREARRKAGLGAVDHLVEG